MNGEQLKTQYHNQVTEGRIFKLLDEQDNEADDVQAWIMGIETLPSIWEFLSKARREKTRHLLGKNKKIEPITADSTAPVAADYSMENKIISHHQKKVMNQFEYGVINTRSPTTHKRLAWIAGN